MRENVTNSQNQQCTNFQNQQCSLFDRKAVFYTLKTFTIISTDFSNKRHQSRMFMGN